MTSYAARSTMSRSTTAMGGRKQQPDIRPSDVHELKLKTQQINSKIRRLKTQRERVGQRITANTNAINKTFEQKSDEPSVVTNHSNTIPNLKRSVQSAQNTLNKLRRDIKETRDHDKTFFVKELQEEVKLAYCEHQRLCRELQDSKIEANQISEELAEVQQRASNAYINELRSTIRDLQEKNASLRDKAVAYYTKREKLVAEQQIRENSEKKVSIEKTLKEANDKKEEVHKQVAEQVQKMEDQKAEHMAKMDELRQILEDQKEKIAAFLEGRTLETHKDEQEEAASEEPVTEEGEKEEKTEE